MKIWDYKEDFREYLNNNYSNLGYQIKFLGEDVNNRTLIFTASLPIELKDPRITSDIRIEFNEKHIKLLRKTKLEKLDKIGNV